MPTPELDTTQHDLESVWELREEVLYPQLFGPVSRGIFVLEFSDFAALGHPECDPRWLHLGVFEFAPTPERPSWLYATSGGSTPWEQEPDQYMPGAESWLGFEFLMETPQQADWPIVLLKRLFAFQVLVMHGRFGDKPEIRYGDRIPIRSPIDRASSQLTHVIAVAPQCVPARQTLPSGFFDFIQFVGATGAEIEYAKAHGTEALTTRLAAAGVAPVTDPKRPEIAIR